MQQISIRKWKWIVASSFNGNNGILYVPKKVPNQRPLYNILEL